VRKQQLLLENIIFMSPQDFRGLNVRFVRWQQLSLKESVEDLKYEQLLRDIEIQLEGRRVTTPPFLFKRV
jgi:hypothetical protein